MKLNGLCRVCGRMKLVRPELGVPFLGGVPWGECADCEDRRETDDKRRKTGKY